MSDLHYINIGNGKPLVFQHGLAAKKEQVSSLLDGMIGVELISMDCPGHGASFLPMNDIPSFNTYSDTLVQLLTNLNLESTCFGGISMGAGIALNIALRYPQRVEGLILLRPAWLSTGCPKNLQILQDLSDLIGKNEAVKEALQNRKLSLINDTYPKAAKSILGIFNPNQQKSLPRVIHELCADHPFQKMEDLEKIKVPCLIIGNDDDPLHPFEMAEQIHERIAHSSLFKVVSRYIDPSLHKKEVQQQIAAFLQNL